MRPLVFQNAYKEYKNERGEIFMNIDFKKGNVFERACNDLIKTLKYSS